MNAANTTVYTNSFEAPKIERIRIGHAAVSNMTFAEVLDALLKRARNHADSTCVVTPNAQHIVLLEKDRAFRSVYDGAEYVLADGISLLIAARLLGKRLRGRIAGVDLFQALCGHAAKEGLRVFFLGGLPGSAAAAARTLQRRYPGLSIAGIYVPPFGFEKDAAQLQQVVDQIMSARPHFVFVGLGAPKQEYWIQEHGRKLSVPVCIGVGGSFEMVGGAVRRAPVWIQSIGFEWLFRLAMEPKRLWKRYLVGNAQFLWIVAKQMTGIHQTAVRADAARSRG